MLIVYTSNCLNGVLVLSRCRYVAGGSVDALLKQYGPLGSNVVARYAAETLAGLIYLHANGIVQCVILEPLSFCAYTTFFLLFYSTSFLCRVLLSLAKHHSFSIRFSCSRS